MTIRVLLADDQELVRAGFRMMLSDRPEIEIIGEARNGREAVAMATRTRPDVVVMDIRMPELDGVVATRMLVRDVPEPLTRVLILTTFDGDEQAVDALRAGASGFLLKDVTSDGLVDAIAAVAAGDALISPSVTRRLLDRFVAAAPTAGDPVRRQRLAGLTARELDVLRLVAAGLSNRAIAARLSLAEPTVKTHVGHLLDKLAVRDRAQLVVLSYELGVVRPGDNPDIDAEPLRPPG